MQKQLHDALTLKAAECLRSLTALRNVATMAQTTDDALEIIQTIALIEAHAAKAREAATAWIRADLARVRA